MESCSRCFDVACNCKAVVICKQLQKCSILQVATAYLQRVVNVLKHLQKCFAKFCKCLILHVARA